MTEPNMNNKEIWVISLWCGLGVWWQVWTLKGFWWGAFYGLLWPFWVGRKLATWLLS